MADWQTDHALVDADAASADEVHIANRTNTAANAYGTVERRTITRAMGTLLAAIRELSPVDGNIIVGDGTTWVAENGATARTSLGAAAATHAHAAADVTSGTFADARISQGSVTQHQAALSITEGQVTNLVTDLAAKAPLANPTFTGTVTLPAAQVTFANIQNFAGLSVLGRGANNAGVSNDLIAGTDGHVLRRSGTSLAFGLIAQTAVTNLATDLAAKAPLASPTFTTALTAANPVFTGTVTVPDGALAIADTSGLQGALDLKAPLASPTFTGTVTVPAGSISYGEMQDVSAVSLLLGRGSAAGVGPPQEITLGTNLSMAGTVLNAAGGGGGGNVTKVGTPADNQLGVWTGDGLIEGDTNLIWSGTLLTITGGLTVTGAVTLADNSLAIADTAGLQTALDAKAPIASPTFTGTVVLPAAQVTYANIQNVAGLSVVGRTANTSGVGGDVTAGVDGDVLRRSGTTLGFGAIPQASVTNLATDLGLKAPLASPVFTTALTAANPTFTGTVALPNDQISYAEMQNVAALSVVGNDTNAIADPRDITAGTDGHVLRRAGTTLGFGLIPQASVTNLTTDLAGKAPTANPVFTGTVTIPDGALAIADTSGLQTALDAKAPLASPTFTTALTAANPTFTGTVTIPDGALAIADTSGLQTALDAKAPAANPVFTGTVTIPDGALAIADTATLQTTLDAKLPLAGGTVTGPIVLGAGGSINDAGPISASGALVKATHGGRAVLTTGNVVIPNAAGDVGMGGIIILGGAHTITFNSTVTAVLAAGDVFTYYVQSTTVLPRSLQTAAGRPAMT